jgi:hypothetical protein
MRTLVLAALLAPAIAAANGRSPQTNGVFLRPADTQSIYIRATFGLLISRDNGCTFRWVCERALGYGGEFDPKYAIAADGTIFATTFDGLRVSRDGGCTWATATAELPRNDPGYIADIWIDALDIAPTGEVWIATAESAQPNDVYSSTDGGVTFQPRGLRSPTIWWKSVKVARTDPERVYLTGYQVAGTSPDGGMASPLARLMRSSDNGQTWTELDLLASDPPMRFGATPIVLIAAVDPKAADTLLLTSLNANGKGDRLYRSTDAGATFTEVLATDDTIRDVVFAADGTVYVAALGGSFKSTDNGATFAPLPGAPQLQCLGQRMDGQLVGCGANWQPDFMAVGTATPDAADWTKIFRFVELAGPLDCPAGTTSNLECDPLWPNLQQQFGATGPTCGAAPDTTVEPPPPPKEGGGCCDAGNGAAGGTLLAGLIAVVLGRRRRHASAARQLG